MDLPNDLAIPLIGIYLKNVTTLIGKENYTPMFTAA